MKIYLYILTLSLTTLASCKKDYNCQCTTTSVEPAYSNGSTVNTPGNTTISNSTSFIRDTKKKATASCEGNSQTYTYTSPYSSYGQGNTVVTIDWQLK